MKDDTHKHRNSRNNKRPSDDNARKERQIDHDKARKKKRVDDEKARNERRVEKEKERWDYLRNRHSRPLTVSRLHADEVKIFRDVAGEFWLAFNTDYLPPRLDSDFGTLGTASLPRFYNEQMPYLCAALNPDGMEGEILETFGTITIVPKGDAFGLEISQLRQWRSLETMTIALCRLLLPHVTTTLDFFLPVAPYMTGYRRRLSNRDHAYNAARSARQAFSLLFGMAAYLIALTPDWGKIGARGGLPRDWLKAVEASPIGGFHESYRRVGAFIDLSRSASELRRLPCLIKKHIPFWIYWGDGKTYEPGLDNELDTRIAKSLFKPNPHEFETRPIHLEDLGSGAHYRFGQMISPRTFDVKAPAQATGILEKFNSRCTLEPIPMFMSGSLLYDTTLRTRSVTPDGGSASVIGLNSAAITNDNLRSTVPEQGRREFDAAARWGNEAPIEPNDRTYSDWNFDASMVWDWDDPLMSKDAPQTNDENLAEAVGPQTHDENVAEGTLQVEGQVSAAALPTLEPYELDQILPGQVERGSRQRSFESPDEFWKRQHEEDEMMLAKKAESDRKRLCNERHGKFIAKKSRVYYWQRTYSGRVRRLVKKSEYEDYDYRYAASQKHFSVSRNEWDVCSDFDPDAEPPFDEDETDEISYHPDWKSGAVSFHQVSSQPGTNVTDPASLHDDTGDLELPSHSNDGHFVSLSRSDSNNDDPASLHASDHPGLSLHSNDGHFVPVPSPDINNGDSASYPDKGNRCSSLYPEITEQSEPARSLSPNVRSTDETISRPIRVRRPGQPFIKDSFFALGCASKGANAEAACPPDFVIASDKYLDMRNTGELPDELILTEQHFEDAVVRRYRLRPELLVRRLDSVSLDEMLYYRYGIMLSAMISALPSDTPLPKAEEEWAKTRAILYDVESATGHFSMTEMLAISEFVRCRLEDRPVPAPAVDIHPENPVRNRLLSAARSMNLLKVHLDRDVYLVQRYENFIVGLEDPSLVVEVLRRGQEVASAGDLDVRDVVRMFAERGSPFRILGHAAPRRVAIDRKRWDLGFRSLDDPPTAVSYAQYEQLLRSFLLEPRARAALYIGGPVWRIVSEYLRPAHAELGVSEQAGICGREHLLPDGSSLWEDSLTESELLFLCGTYKVRKGVDTMFYSWWPSPKQWEAATPNVRYWSPSNERWFVARLSDIRSGKASWIKAADWPMKLRNNKKTKRLMNTNNEHCERFLQTGEVLFLPSRGKRTNMDEA